MSTDPPVRVWSIFSSLPYVCCSMLHVVRRGHSLRAARFPIPGRIHGLFDDAEPERVAPHKPSRSQQYTSPPNSQVTSLSSLSIDIEHRKVGPSADGAVNTRSIEAAESGEVRLTVQRLYQLAPVSFWRSEKPSSSPAVHAVSN